MSGHYPLGQHGCMIYLRLELPQNQAEVIKQGLVNIVFVDLICPLMILII